MLNRRQLRDQIFQLLFQVDFKSEEEMEDQLTYTTDELKKATPEDIQYIKDKFHLIQANITALDERINAKTTRWKTTRMNKVDLAIIRLAVYEIFYDDDIPTNVAVNEAVELGKTYSSDEGPAFINAVLTNIIS